MSAKLFMLMEANLMHLQANGLLMEVKKVTPVYASAIYILVIRHCKFFQIAQKDSLVFKAYKETRCYSKANKNS